MKSMFTRIMLASAISLSAAVLPSSAQTFTTLANFIGSNGEQPEGPLVQGANGNLYGVTSGGGLFGACKASAGCGTVFEVNPAGYIRTLYKFCSQSTCSDGWDPPGPLLLSPNGNLFGTTQLGGNRCFLARGCGTIFQITPAGTLTTLYRFCAQEFCPDGYAPAGLIQGPGGKIYGTTSAGGAHDGGSVFALSPSGNLTTLYSFCALVNCDDGGSPSELIFGADGNLYGTTEVGGTYSAGTFFKLTRDGVLTLLQQFCSQYQNNACLDGRNPLGPLVQDSNGNFLGTTSNGGTSDSGSVFQISPIGQLTTLYSFCSQVNIDGCADGAYPTGLLMGSDGNLYGTTHSGGSSNAGTAFEVTPSGALTTLYNFCHAGSGCADGETPVALAQGTDGVFYGGTSLGGTPANCGSFAGCGTIYKLSNLLPAFVAANPGFAKVGQQVGILGNNLTGATSVTFNGVPAAFAVVADTLIKATVPTGATTGILQVITPSGTFSSNVAFRVLP